ncbi:hypothetical protein [Phragmitibacter flavus]|nr:hypothetical protein [Phragmitibacter flavus]
MTLSIFTVLVGLAFILSIISLVNGKVPLAVAVILICVALLFPR